MNGNRFVTWALRSPFYGILGNTMLITIAGRKTGRPITTPVNYIRAGSALWILSTRTRKWWRNISAGTPVSLHIEGRDVAGTADVVTEETAVTAQLEEYLRQLPIAARPLGVTVVGGVPNPTDLRRLAKERVFVKVCLL